MEKWTPIFWIIGSGIGLLAFTLLVDLLKAKTTKHLRNKNPLDRDFSTLDA